MTNQITIASKLGQLGNRLILFAHLVALAREHGFALTNPAFAEYAADFEGPSSGLLCPYPAGGGQRHSAIACDIRVWLARLARKMRLQHVLGAVIDNPSMEPKDDFNLNSAKYLQIIRGSRHCTLWGWRYRNYELVPKHADAIRLYFRPIRARRETAEALVGGMRQPSGCVVGVHIRQGDYQGFQGGRHFFATADYVACMRQVADEMARGGMAPVFLVCSNVRQDPADFAGLTVRFGTGQITEDLHALGLCSRILVVPSTYSYWASFMGKVPLQYMSRAADGKVVLADPVPFPEEC